MTPPTKLDDGFARQLPDADASLTDEWVDSLDAVIDVHGPAAARLMLSRLPHRAAERDMGFPTRRDTPYLNSISPGDEPDYPGEVALERRIEGLVRWNAAVMVTRANLLSDGIGGHLSTPASAACLYEMGFNHFFRGKDDTQGGDQVFFQGHATPGIYARAFLEGRITEDQLDHFRREIGGGGLSSYPHPRLMPEFWEFPTVSMGLGPINAIYQARFNRYLAQRGVVDTSAAKVWCFLGDGECDEPETLGALSIAAREGLDNLIFVVNCNLQRLDGPVRGNGKIIQELESVFRGAGWNVAKVVWGARWEELLSADHGGVLLDKMDATLDGEYQKYAVEGPAYVRKHFFGADPRLQEMVAHLPDDDPVFTLPRGGHDRRKLYAAYVGATTHKGSPSVILAKTLKGSRLGTTIESRNAAHQVKKIARDQLGALRDRLGLADRIPDGALAADLPPYVRLQPGSDEERYLLERRRVLGGAIPKRVVNFRPPGQPAPGVFDDLLGGSGDRSVSTTMAFAGLLRSLLRDDTMGSRVVPIVPDEARTFGLDSLFSEVKIYAHAGQRYDPVDGAMTLSYRESEQGQILEEGITEAGSMASFGAAGTAYATWGEAMIPFYIFYSMFGFQRVGDLIWAFGDIRGRGFLLGATAGRTTLNGEGLQHQDGHSLVLASTVPNLAAYDPAFAYEVATIIRDGIARMYGDDPEDVFYYLTLYNENYPMPPDACRRRRGHPRGDLPFRHRSGSAIGQGRGPAGHDPVQRHGPGSGPRGPASPGRAPRRGRRALERHVLQGPARRGIGGGAVEPPASDRTGSDPIPDRSAGRDRRPDGGHHRLHEGSTGPGLRLGPRPSHHVGNRRLRALRLPGCTETPFETDAGHLVVAVLAALADTGNAKPEEVADAITRYDIDPEALEPLRA